MSDLPGLDLVPLPFSLGKPLGDYYQDFLPVLPLVESGYHGDLDSAGVPRVRYPHQGLFHNAITIAQYALANVSAVLRGDSDRKDRLRTQCDWLVEHLQPSGLWTMEFDNPKYPWLRAPWSSALAQGQALSALLRGAELLADPRYEEAARVGYDALHRTDIPQPLAHESGDELWYEEYPADPPLHVLNGHAYALLGVVDFFRTFDDEIAHSRWRRAARTLAAHLDEFDLGYWSAYDLRTKEPVDLHYHKNIHIPQLRILHALEGSPLFGEVADRWGRYMADPFCRMRRAVALRLRGLRRRVGLLGS